MVAAAATMTLTTTTAAATATALVVLLWDEWPLLGFCFICALSCDCFSLKARRIFTNRALHTLNRNLLCCVRFLDANKIEWPIHRVFCDGHGSHWKGLETCNQIDVEGAMKKRLELYGEIAAASKFCGWSNWMLSLRCWMMPRPQIAYWFCVWKLGTKWHIGPACGTRRLAVAPRGGCSFHPDMKSVKVLWLVFLHQEIQTSLEPFFYHMLDAQNDQRQLPFVNSSWNVPGIGNHVAWIGTSMPGSSKKLSDDPVINRVPTENLREFPKIFMTFGCVSHHG